MTAPHIVDPAGLLGEVRAEASPDLMRSLLQSIINALLMLMLTAGDSALFPIGWKGIWTVHESLCKVFVVYRA